MYKAQNLVSMSLETNSLFKTMLYFYPAPYRKRFEEEILLVLSDVYQEELDKKGSVSLTFWLFQCTDLGKSILEQHMNFLAKYGFKKYMKHVLHINKYNTMGIFLLLPFFSIFLVDVMARVLQWNLLHPNQLISHGLYNSPLYWFPILFAWVFLFPIMAIFINIIPLVKNGLKIKNNLLTVSILLMALSAVAIIYVHDLIPCIMQSVVSHGIFNIKQIVSLCKDA